jgi:hypothetical protein
MLSTGGIKSPPKVVDSLIFVHPKPINKKQESIEENRKKLCFLTYII